MTTVTQTRGATVLASVTYTYDAMSRVRTTTRANGVTTTNTWTVHNKLNTQRTTSAFGALIEEHDYTYDSHGNVATRVDTDPAVSATPTSAGTWTTAYRYDAYNRLLGSATYAGPNTAGQPATSTSYTINTAGDVVGITTVTRPQASKQPPPTSTQKPKKKKPRPVSSPPPFTATTTNTIDPAGQLTAQATNGTTVNQAFDGEGRVTHSLNGSAMTYDAFDRMLTATRGGTTATYTYWPDGTRRSTTTSGTAVGTSSQTFHYGPDGTLVNDTTADPTTGTAATTASYLLTAGREARTLQPGTTTTGTVPTGAPAAITTGTGTGYLLRDRHSSVTALVDANGAVTNTYQYGDYGTAAQPDGQPQPASTPAPGGRTNPFQYTGATPTSSMTDATTGQLLLPARSYDPAQGRFTSRDTANVFNHYQGFSTNPIVFVDTTGHFSLEDLLVDIGTAIVFAFAAVLTGGAALTALPAVMGAEVGALTVSTVVSTVAGAVAAVASATGFVASAVKAADDIGDAVSGKHFLSTEQRSALGTVQVAAGAVAGVAGLASVGASAAGAIAEGAEQDAVSFLADADDETDVTNVTNKRDAYVEGEQNDRYLYLGPGDTIPPDPDLSNLSEETASYIENDAGSSSSSSDSIVNGVTGRAAQPRPVTPSLSRAIPMQRNVLQRVIGSTELNATDNSVITGDSGLTASINADDAAEDSSTGSLAANPTRPTLTAANGNWGQEANTFGTGRYTNDIITNLNTDDRNTFMQYFTQTSIESSVEELNIPWNWLG